MPKLVDYAARFEFIREAAFAIVLDDGPSSLSRQAVADALGMSLSTIRRLVRPDASLAGIAAQERRLCDLATGEGQPPPVTLTG